MSTAAERATRPPRPAHAPGSSAPDAASIAHMLAEIGRIQADDKPDIERLPKRLSPSRAMDYRQCPQLFYYKSIAKLSSPPTEATARGTVAHTAFERIFDHPAGERTPELAMTYLRPAWEELVNPTLDPVKHKPGSVAYERAVANAKAYRDLAPAGSQTETDILEFAAMCVKNWFAMERVNNFNSAELTLPSGETIDGRELHVGAAMFGVYMQGFIDRLDSWKTPTGMGYSVSDFKTGKVPAAGKDYPSHVMDRILWDSFFQLRVYAVLAWEVHQIPVRQLRLIYVATGDRENGIKTLAVTQDVINRTKTEIRAVWNAMQRSARNQTWQTKTGPLCAWCYFVDFCPAFSDDTTPAAATGA